MDANRFDRLTRKVAHRVSRRGTLGAGGLGLGAVMPGRARDACPASDPGRGGHAGCLG